MKEYVTVASFHIRGADRMTDVRRRDIAQWLRRQAKFLVEEGVKDKIAPRFTARYQLPPEVTAVEAFMTEEKEKANAVG